MAEDRYRLAPVRDARQRHETVRRGELATAIGDAAITEADLAATAARTSATRDQLAAALATRETLSAGPLAAAQLVRADHYIARCRGALALARDAELRARAAHDARAEVVDLARATLVRARADREVIERHFARWRDTQRKLADRRED